MTKNRNENADLKKKSALESIEDKALREAVIKELQRKEKNRKIITRLCMLLAALCLGYFGIYTYMQYRTQNSSSEWAKLKEQSVDNAGTTKDSEVIVHKTGEIEVPDILSEYQTLWNKNKSLIGWVKIADTNIDYPVMQTENNEYYLNHNFNQEYDKNGCIFMDAGCDVVDRSTNLILYGHHMKSGAMFGQLEKYASEDFYKEHPTFQFDTIYEKAVYQVAYVFRSRVYSEDEIVFKYYQFIDANSETEFNSYMDEMANMSLFDTGITPVYGDELVTLSTCDRSQIDEGRFVVVGVKVN